MPKTTVAVVGPCASGKSTIVQALRDIGLDAYSVAQEHSIIGDLWNHREPEIVVYLDVSLDAIRDRRRNPHWPAWIYDLQIDRLSDARSNATFVVDTSTKSSDEIIDELRGAIQANSLASGGDE